MKRGTINNYIRNTGINQTVSGKLGCTGNLIIRMFTGYFHSQITCLGLQLRLIKELLFSDTV